MKHPAVLSLSPFQCSSITATSHHKDTGILSLVQYSLQFNYFAINFASEPVSSLKTHQRFNLQDRKEWECRSLSVAETSNPAVLPSRTPGEAERLYLLWHLCSCPATSSLPLKSAWVKSLSVWSLPIPAPPNKSIIFVLKSAYMDF